MKPNTTSHRRTDRSTTLGDDDRGVSALLGGILLFALVVALIALIQINAVPAANEQVEFEHNQRVQGDMQELQESQFRVASTGTEATVKIETGTGYPQRFFLLNPSRPSGSLRTQALENIVISNATATGETGDYWDGNSHRFNASSLTYEAYYNEYGNAPQTVAEHGTLFNNHSNGQTTLIERGALISGREISLIALQGDLSTTSDRSVTVGMAPVSAPAQTITVANGTAPITLTIPTQRSVEDWNESLADEKVSVGGHVQTVTAGSTPDTVNITLQQGVTYSMRLAAVGIASGYDPTPDPAYIVDTAGNGSTVPENGTQRLVVQVRDEYNNPVPNQTVNATTQRTNSDVTVLGSNKTDANGEVTLEYTAPQQVGGLSNDRITAWYGGGATPSTVPVERVEFDVSVADTDGSGGNSNPQASSGNPINPGVTVVLKNADLFQPGGGCSDRNQGCEVEVTFENLDASSGYNVTEMRVSFYSTEGTDTSPTTATVADAETLANNKNYAIGGDFSSGTHLDRFGKADPTSSNDEQKYRFSFSGFKKPNGNPAGNGVAPGDFFVIEVILEDDSNDRIIVTYFIGPS